jgi:hypothetical protein
VRELREKGVVEWDSPYIFENKPIWTALEAFEDVIFPIQSYSLQRAAFVARRELLTEVELRERGMVEGWDEDWVERTSKHKGEMRRITANLHRTDQYLYEQLRDMIEVWHVYRKEIDEKTGAVRVTRSIMSFHVPDKVAIHEILPYAHGLYPFVELARERTTRPLLESRGVPEICQTAQNEIKTQRDFRVDAASLSVLPPVRVPANRGKFDLVLGPGVQIPERRQGEVSFMEPPRVSQGSIEVEAATRLDVDNYFGRMSQGVPPQLSMLHTQELIDTWLLDMKLCVVQTMALAQQYMSPEEVARVTGNQLPFNASPQDIRGRFDITAEFDARMLDAEALGAKLDYLAKILVPMDSFGVIDRVGLIKYMFQAVDPNMAAMLVQDIGAATQQEIEDEQVQFSKIAAGTEPPMKEGGQNAQVRLQTFQQIIQSPTRPSPSATSRTKSSAACSTPACRHSNSNSSKAKTPSSAESAPSLRSSKWRRSKNLVVRRLCRSPTQCKKDYFMAAFPNVAVRNVAGFNIPQFTSVELSYVGATNNLSTVVYKEGATTVATLTFTYVGGTPGADDADIATITKSLMAFKFNPFTGTLDQTGSGGGASYIDGEVQNFSALPETIGTPAVDSAYLVREAEGTWLLARKPAGIYIRTADTGVRAADWTHAAAFPDVFSDAAFTVSRMATLTAPRIFSFPTLRHHHRHHPHADRA